MKLGKCSMRLPRSGFQEWGSAARQIKSLDHCIVLESIKYGAVLFYGARSPLLNIIRKSYIRKWFAGARQIANSRKE